MINFSAIMLDKQLKDVNVEIEATTWTKALNGLEKIYPDTRCIQLEARGVRLVLRDYRWCLK